MCHSARTGCWVSCSVMRTGPVHLSPKLEEFLNSKSLCDDCAFWDAMWCWQHRTRDVTRNDGLGVLAPSIMDHWIEEDPTIEMRGTYSLPLSFEAINSGSPPPRVTVYLFWPTKPIPSGSMFSLLSERLVMSSPNSFVFFSVFISVFLLSQFLHNRAFVNRSNSNIVPRGELCEGQRSERCCWPGRSCWRVIPLFRIWLGRYQGHRVHLCLQGFVLHWLLYG